jgi:hypothetical protein
VRGGAGGARCRLAGGGRRQRLLARAPGARQRASLWLLFLAVLTCLVLGSSTGRVPCRWCLLLNSSSDGGTARGPAQDEMGEHAVSAVVATWPGEDGQPEVHFEVRRARAPPLQAVARQPCF